MKCFDYHKKFNKECEKRKCRYWIASSKCNNCCISGASSKENFTLQDVGKIFNVTRMRICQIEKIAIQKLKNKILNLD